MMQSYHPHHQQPFPTYSHPLPSHYPSVFESTLHSLDTSTLSLDGYSSYIMPGSPTSSSARARRQRVSMACSYCRHRKIRCCGGVPCKNCDKAGKDCDYAPVPEEVNRATRAKKAASKAQKKTSDPRSDTSSVYAAYTNTSGPVDRPVFPGHPNGTYHHANGYPYTPTPGQGDNNAQQAFVPGHSRSSSDPNQVVGPMPWQTPVIPQHGQDQSPRTFDDATDNWTYDQPHPNTAPVTQLPTFDYPVYPQAPQQHQHQQQAQHQYPGQYHQQHHHQQQQQQQTQTQTRGQHLHMQLPSHANSGQQAPTSYSTPPLHQSGYLHPILPVTPLNNKGQQQAHVYNTHPQYTDRSKTMSTSTNGSIPNTPAPPYFTSQSGYPTPVYSPLNLHPHSRDNNSPTLAPEYSLSQQKDPLVGLGIGIGMGMGSGSIMGAGAGTGFGSNPSSSHSSSSVSLSKSNEGQTQDMNLGLQFVEDTFYTSPYCA